MVARLKALRRATGLALTKLRTLSLIKQPIEMLWRHEWPQESGCPVQTIARLWSAARASPFDVRRKSEMLKWIGIVTASTLGAFAALAADEPAPTVAPAAVRLPTEQAPTPVKTGKERLSSKASDEQRVDNCKVPPELRGTAARSDTCERKPQATPTN